MDTPSPNRDVTRLIERACDGDPAASHELLPLIYDQLHRLAQQQMAHEPPGHTLQPTALVHEAYLRLVGDEDISWNSRGHFYGAAAQAMRRILVERARRYRRARHGAGHQRRPLHESRLPVEGEPVDLLALDEALDRLQQRDPRLTEIVMLRHFGGLSHEQIAAVLGVSARTVRREWQCARLWLFQQLTGDDRPSPTEAPSDG